MDRDDGVAGVVLAAEHLLDLAGFDLALELVEAGGELGFDGFALLQPVGEDREILDAAAQRPDQVHVLFEPAAALHHPLRLGLVLPEVGLADPGFDAGQFFRGACGVKDNSASQPTAS
jgi:hypothetical protein